jgi:hypothetical protein
MQWPKESHQAGSFPAIAGCDGLAQTVTTMKGSPNGLDPRGSPITVNGDPIPNPDINIVGGSDAGTNSSTLENGLQNEKIRFSWEQVAEKPVSEIVVQQKRRLSTLSDANPGMLGSKGGKGLFGSLKSKGAGKTSGMTSILWHKISEVIRNAIQNDKILIHTTMYFCAI